MLVYLSCPPFQKVDDTTEEDEEVGDDFANLYKGEISKSGIPILPSKRARKIPEKILVSKEDLAELENINEEQVAPENIEENVEDQNPEVSLDEIKEKEASISEQEDTDSTNS